MATVSNHLETAFPLDWSEIQVSGVPFQFDPMHTPLPISPLEASVAGPAFEPGFANGHKRLGTAVEGVEVIYPNRYLFRRVIWGEPVEDQAHVIEARIREMIGAQMESWQVEYLPRLEELISKLKEIDLTEAPMANVQASLDELHEIAVEFWDIHFRIVFAMQLSIQLFSELYADLFEATEAEAHELLAGSWSKSIEAGLGLGDLAVAARELGLERVILDTPDEGVFAALASAPGGDVFVAKLWAFLDRFGYRQDLYQFTMPTWLERPSLALGHVRQYLRTGRDPRAEYEATARSVEDATDAVRARLSGYPQPVRDQFEAMLAFARQGAFLQEEHNYYIDQHLAALLRLRYLDVGRRLVGVGIIDAPEDVFMLDISEVRALLVEPAGLTGDETVRSLVRQRWQEMEIAATLAPPSILGDPSTLPEPGDSPGARAMLNFFGGPPQPRGPAGELRGNPASRGVATGRARVARSLEEAQGMQPGEILVAVTTMPPWTPLFGVAAAVVTETGGSLSHCAIVAREYGIPAVAGVYGATRAIADGAMVTVDGTAGTVTIDS